MNARRRRAAGPSASPALVGAASLVMASLAGAVLFAWPLVAPGAPAGSAASAVALGTLAALVGLEVASRQLGTRGIALLAALSSLDAAARAAVVTGIGGFSPIFLLILCGGYALGPAYGFLTGATSLLVSALVTGGIGPWLPYQLFAAGWVGAAAGLAGLSSRARRRRVRPGRSDVWLLAGVGVATGYGYGMVMDLWQWTFFRSSPGLGFHAGMPFGAVVGRFSHFYIATSFVYDSFRAAGNAVIVLAVGLPVLVTLARVRSRYGFEVVGRPE
ncbi:MAG: ECF transporter S component [Acidimicrobiales bacterium]